MKNEIAVADLKNCLTVDGKFNFHCSYCRKQWQLTAPKNKRKLQIRCMCGHECFVKLNRRQYLRKPVSDRKAHMVIFNKSTSLVTLVDSSYGGYCVEVKPHIAKRLNVCDFVTLQDYHDGLQCVDGFLVCSVRGNRVGLQHADKKFLSPNQRMIASQNNIKRN